MSSPRKGLTGPIVSPTTGPIVLPGSGGGGPAPEPTRYKVELAAGVVDYKVELASGTVDYDINLAS